MAEAIKTSPRLEATIRKDLRRIASLRQNWREKTAAGFASWAVSSASGRIHRSVALKFYRWATDIAPMDDASVLLPLDFSELSRAVMRYEGDKETEDYLLRAAQRLQDSSCEGFVLHDSAGLPVHFGWTMPFEGSQQPELRLRQDAADPNAVMIFDSWTPVAQRRRGYFRQAICCIAKQLAPIERSIWISFTEPNLAASRAIEKAGFQFMYSIAPRDAGRDGTRMSKFGDKAKPVR